MKSKIFVPKIGQLVTWTTIDPSDGNIEMWLVFNDDKDYPEHHQVLARFERGKTEPYFGGFISGSVLVEVGVAACGDVLIRSPASSENLRLMASTWRKKSYNVSEWYKKVLTVPGLLGEELVRIERAFELNYI